MKKWKINYFVFLLFLLNIKSIGSDEQNKSFGKQNRNLVSKLNNNIQVKGYRDRNSASEGVLTIDSILAKPLYNAGEIAELVPGVISTGHSGGGKAN